MKELGHYSKIAIRAADGSFTDKRENLPNISNSVYEIIRPDTNKVKRLYALLSLLRKSLPEKVWEKSGVSGAFRDLSHFPLDLEKYQLKERVGSGYQCDCYLFEPLDKDNNETWVLKVFQNGEDNLSKLEAKTRQVNADYATLTDWYKEMEGLIPKQSVFIGEHFQLPRNRPAVFILQKFLGRDLKDLVEDFTEEEWGKLCDKSPELKEQVKKFLEITKQNIEKQGKHVDLLGHSNLSVADASTDSPHLVFIDPDGIEEFNNTEDPKRKALNNKRFELLDKRAGV